MQDDELSNFFPTSFGKKSSSTPKGAAASGGSDLDWEAFRSQMPSSFGKQKEQKDSRSHFAKTKRTENEAGDNAGGELPEQSDGVKRLRQDDGLPIPIKAGEQKEEDLPIRSKVRERKEEDGDEDSDNDEEDEDDDDEDDNDANDGKELVRAEILPISHEIKLNDHHKTVSALTLDPSGARLISGGYDYDVKFWDFAGMDGSLRPFRSIEPCGGHQIHDLHYSLTGDSFLIVPGSSRPKIYDRDGFEIQEFAKGDPYIRDMRNTDGHVASLTAGCWHPQHKDTFITASQDSTIRIWDAENKRKQKQVVVHKSKDRGGRASVTSATYSLDGKWITGACQDGTLNLWPANGPYLRPALAVQNAHMVGTETSSILWSVNHQTLVTRGGDDTVKVWDIRNFKDPVRVANNLPTINPEVNVVFSPDERLIVTGTAVKKNEGYGKLVMMDRETLEIRRTMSITKSSVVRVLWHSKINQIITGSADGTVSVFYDPATSVRGAKLCVVKATKTRAIDDYEIDRPVITPHALPMFRDDKPRTMKRKREKMRKDPLASHKPEMPISGPGKGGKVGTNITQHIMKDLIKDTTRDEDPRAALLKYANVAEQDPMWVGKAYEKTQPKSVLAEETGEQDEKEAPRRR